MRSPTTREFSALGLPEEMAYVAWAETQFDPKAKSPVGAAEERHVPRRARTAGLFDLLAREHGLIPHLRQAARTIGLFARSLVLAVRGRPRRSRTH